MDLLGVERSHHLQPLGAAPQLGVVPERGEKVERVGERDAEPGIWPEGQGLDVRRPALRGNDLQGDAEVPREVGDVLADAGAGAAEAARQNDACVGGARGAGGREEGKGEAAAKDGAYSRPHDHLLDPAETCAVRAPALPHVAESDHRSWRLLAQFNELAKHTSAPLPPSRTGRNWPRCWRSRPSAASLGEARSRPRSGTTSPAPSSRRREWRSRPRWRARRYEIVCGNGEWPPAEPVPDNPRLWQLGINARAERRSALWSWPGA